VFRIRHATPKNAEREVRSPRPFSFVLLTLAWTSFISISSVSFLVLRSGSVRDGWAQLSGSPIRFRPDHADLGTVAAGSTALRNVDIVNDSDSHLYIIGTQSSCYCVATGVESLIIAPHSTHRIPVQIHLVGSTSDYQQSLTLYASYQQKMIVLRFFVSAHLVMPARGINTMSSESRSRDTQTAHMTLCGLI
jgi:hypothetical protein